MAEGVREAVVSVGRKNAKSAAIAVYLLGRLAGPLRTRGYRAGVCSVSKEKASGIVDAMLRRLPRRPA